MTDKYTSSDDEGDDIPSAQVPPNTSTPEPSDTNEDLDTVDTPPKAEIDSDTTPDASVTITDLAAAINVRKCPVCGATQAYPSEEVLTV